MKIQAIIKQVGEEQSGISPRTGNPWKTRQLLLEMPDAENEAAGLPSSNYISVGVFNEDSDMLANTTGRSVECLLDIRTTVSHNGWTNNNIRIHNIRLL